MKKIIYISLIVATTVFCITSCSDEFLEVNPTGSLSSEILATEVGIDLALISSYSMLLGRVGIMHKQIMGLFLKNIVLLLRELLEQIIL